MKIELADLNQRRLSTAQNPQDVLSIVRQLVHLGGTEADDAIVVALWAMDPSVDKGDVSIGKALADEFRIKQPT